MTPASILFHFTPSTVRKPKIFSHFVQNPYVSTHFHEVASLTTGRAYEEGKVSAFITQSGSTNEDPLRSFPEPCQRAPGTATFCLHAHSNGLLTYFAQRQSQRKPSTHSSPNVIKHMVSKTPSRENTK